MEMWAKNGILNVVVGLFSFPEWSYHVSPVRR